MTQFIPTIDPLDLMLSSYDYELPEDLVAARPLSDRPACRLLVYSEETDQVWHTTFANIGDFLPPGPLVLNSSKVIPCRLLGQGPEGGKREVFLLGLTPIKENLYNVLLKSAGKKKIGDEIFFSAVHKARLEEVNQDGTFLVSFNLKVEELLETYGKLPLPPYIRQGQADGPDQEDYQTVYAETPGSLAAPTAGLHFDQDLLARLSEKHPILKVNLHVGLGTFMPVSTDSLLQHKMHQEEYLVEPQTAEILRAHRGHLTAVGTTSLRVLESFERGGLQGKTDLFLYPGKEVRSIQALITNFHLPKSTLLMLVSSLIGRSKTLELYRIAIQEKYRFFSYGDAMLILRKKGKNV